MVFEEAAVSLRALLFHFGLIHIEHLTHHFYLFLLLFVFLSIILYLLFLLHVGFEFCWKLFVMRGDQFFPGSKCWEAGEQRLHG